MKKIHNGHIAIFYNSSFKPLLHPLWVCVLIIMILQHFMRTNSLSCGRSGSNISSKRFPPKLKPLHQRWFTPMSSTEICPAMRKNGQKYHFKEALGSSWSGFHIFNIHQVGRSGGQSGYAGIEARQLWASGDLFSLADHHNLRHWPLLYTHLPNQTGGGSAFTVYF